MDTYLREPAFWETLDGDIKAVPVEQPFGRAVNSDVWALRGMTLAETNLDKVDVTSHLNQWREDYVIYDTEIPAIPSIDTLVRWADKHPEKVNDKVVEYLLSLEWGERIPRDADCQSFVNSQDGVGLPLYRWRSDKRMKRGVGFLLWGGDHLIRAMMPMQSLRVGTHTEFKYGLGFYRYTVARMMASDWRMDTSVSYREMALLATALGERFDHGKLMMSEVIHAAARNRSLLMDVVRRDVHRDPDWNSLQLDAVGMFRSASNDDSALLWCSYFDTHVGGYTRTSYGVARVREMLDRILAIASQVSFTDALPFMEAGILHGDIIADAVRNGIDVDMILPLVDSVA